MIETYGNFSRPEYYVPLSLILQDSDWGRRTYWTRATDLAGRDPAHVTYIFRLG